jgi:YggT family protein
MSGFFNQAGLFLVYVVFGFYILTLLLRFLFQLVRADFYNPFAQFVVALTNPPLKPLRRLIPGLFGIDLASVLLLIVLQIIELFLVGWISGRIPPFTLLFAQALIELVKLTLHVFLFAIIIRAVMSWFSPYGLRANPVGALLTDLTEPVMRPARRLIPTVSGIDLSPIVAIVVLQLLVMLLDHLAPALYRLLLGA